MNDYIFNQKAVSSGDHSFDARNDGKHLYCFSNEAWSASRKEVSFNVHGIVYVPESEAPSDPLETEGVCWVSTSASLAVNSDVMSFSGGGEGPRWVWKHLALRNGLLTVVRGFYS